MNHVYYRITLFVFIFIVTSCSLALAQSDTTLFNCLTPDSVFPVAPAGQQSLNPVAIYACGTYAANKQLPSWSARIWQPDTQHSVTRFYRDNSLGKYILNSRSFGRTIDSCFTFTGTGANSGLDRETVSGYFQEVMPQADNVINFAEFDRDTNGTVDGLFFMIVNHTGRDDGFANIDRAYNFGYVTHDVNAHGDTVIVDGGLVVVVKASISGGRERAVAIAAHEWGHVLGLPEFYGTGWGGFNVLGWWNLGSFSIMGAGFPSLRAVPFDPWSRIFLDWDTAIVVNSSLYGQSIPDYLTTGKIYKLS